MGAEGCDERWVRKFLHRLHIYVRPSFSESEPVGQHGRKLCFPVAQVVPELPHALSTGFNLISMPAHANNRLLYHPCTKCPQWFKNRSGLTQHQNAIHSVFRHSVRTPDSPQCTSITPEPHLDDDDFNDPTGFEPDVDGTEFVGTASKTYRNYHMLLDGEGLLFVLEHN